METMKLNSVFCIQKQNLTFPLNLDTKLKGNSQTKKKKKRKANLYQIKKKKSCNFGSFSFFWRQFNPNIITRNLSLIVFNIILCLKLIFQFDLTLINCIWLKLSLIYLLNKETYKVIHCFFKKGAKGKKSYYLIFFYHIHEITYLFLGTFECQHLYIYIFFFLNNDTQRISWSLILQTIKISQI